MRKPIFLSFLISTIVLFSFLQVSSQQTQTYSRVKVHANKAQFQKLLSKGVCFDEIADKKDSYFIGDFSANEISLMKEEKLRVDVVIDDLTQDFLKRNKKDQSTLSQSMRTGGTPPGFSYGSMGGYLTYSQMVAELDELKTLYPNLITTKSSLGTSAEGRAIWMVKISDNPELEESLEEGVLYTGLTHAREPISMMSLTYFMQYILSKYGTDPEITCLINNRELYFIPCVNPDGYVYNQTTNPNGGGFWRKNRRNNGDGTFGVDINRNFDYNWGFDNSGSSPVTSSEVYRGPGAGSEIETSILKSFVSSNQLSIALNTHTYGNKVILPFEYNSSATANEIHYNSVASILTYENKYLYGKNMQMVGYNANGSADDWMYGMNSLYAYTVETGHDSVGFWPVQSRIIPVCEQNLDLNISAAWAAGKYIKSTVPANIYASGLTYDLPITVTNVGNTPGSLETVSLVINDPRVLLYDLTPILCLGLGVDNSITVPKNITFSPLATAGTINATLVTTTTEGCIYNTPISFQYSPNGCFLIPALWTALDIGLPGLLGSSCYQNGVYTVKGSGTGIQQTSDKCHMMKATTVTSVYEIKAQLLTIQNTAANARAGISIAESTAPGSKRVSLVFNPVNNRIEFQTRANTNGSLNIQNVANSNIPKWLKITKTSGNFWNAYYSLNGVNWTLITKQKVILPTNVIAGLVVTSGSILSLNTATFDNLLISYNGGTISRSSDLTAMALEETENNATGKFAIYPNPSNGILEVRLPASAVNQTISVFDINGREVLKENMGSNYKRFNLSHLSNGLYYIRYKEGTKAKYEKFIINK